LTHVTVYWELSYWALVWPRLTRPIVLAMAIPLHMGIAVCLGMSTFGLIMLVGNMAFVPAWFVREWLPVRSAGQGREVPREARGSNRGPGKTLSTRTATTHSGR
jgi:hypothetical protein